MIPRLQQWKELATRCQRRELQSIRALKNLQAYLATFVQPPYNLKTDTHATTGFHQIPLVEEEEGLRGGRLNSSSPPTLPFPSGNRRNSTRSNNYHLFYPHSKSCTPPATLHHANLNRASKPLLRLDLATCPTSSITKPPSYIHDFTPTGFQHCTTCRCLMGKEGPTYK